MTESATVVYIATADRLKLVCDVQAECTFMGRILARETHCVYA